MQRNESNRNRSNRNEANRYGSSRQQGDHGGQRSQERGWYMHDGGRSSRDDDDEDRWSREDRGGDDGGWSTSGRDAWQGGGDDREYRDRGGYYEGSRDERDDAGWRASQGGGWDDRGNQGRGSYGGGYGQERGGYGARGGYRDGIDVSRMDEARGGPEGRFRRDSWGAGGTPDRGGGYGGEQGSYRGGGYGEQGTYRGGGQDQGASMHRGKGPKGYTRSDDRIREDVCELLEDADLDASEIEVKVESGVVTLSGTVSDRSAKRRAEDIAGSARGVKDTTNQLRLGSPSTNGAQRSESGNDQRRANATSGASSSRTAST
jgi:hypothetical protein